jgi:tripartite-type tricarboxylate transporter receptor subunit TctC
MKTCSWLLIPAALAVAGTAAAQTYPARTVRIVTAGAGGGSDQATRLIATPLAAALGQQVIVDNRGLLAADVAAKAAPDGYTLLLSGGTLWLLRYMRANVVSDIEDFTPVSLATDTANILVVHPTLPAKSVKELIALARARPGQLNYATSGTGNSVHIAGELFKSMAGVDIVHVPYKGSSGARTGVLGGQVEMMFDAVTVMSEHVRAGKVRALATTGKVRSSVMPDVPTVDEAGVPGYDAVIWLGIMAPKGTPPAIVSKLNAEITRIVQDPAIKADWARQGATGMSMTPAQFTQFLDDDIVKWARVVKVSGARPDR